MPWLLQAIPDGVGFGRLTLTVFKELVKTGQAAN